MTSLNLIISAETIASQLTFTGTRNQRFNILYFGWEGDTIHPYPQGSISIAGTHLMPFSQIQGHKLCNILQGFTACNWHCEVQIQIWIHKSMLGFWTRQMDQFSSPKIKAWSDRFSQFWKKLKQGPFSLCKVSLVRRGRTLKGLSVFYNQPCMQKQRCVPPSSLLHLE